MSTYHELIPRPPIVRESLARHIREGRLLRSLLRLAVRAAEEWHRQEHHEPQAEVVRPEVSRGE